MTISSVNPASVVQEAIFPDELLQYPVFRMCSKVEVARLMNFAVRRSVPAGEVLFQQGGEPGMSYWIEAGEIALLRDGQKLANRSGGFIGFDGLVGCKSYNETATATQETTLICFPVGSLDGLAKHNNAILKQFFQTYQSRLESGGVHANTSLSGSGEGAGGGAAWSGISAWLLVSVLPLLLCFAGFQLGFDAKIVLFTSIIAVSVLLWVFDLVPAFVPPLFSVLLIILFDVAPPKVALSGYSSGTFFMCISIFGISALMIKSGLAYRLALNLLLLIPANRSWYGIVLFSLGGLLSLVVPSRNGRVSIVGPFLIEILGMIKARQNDLRATQFITSSLYGATLLGPVFMTGNSLNLILYGMFDEQTRYNYQWLFWLLAASVPGILLFCGFIFLSEYYFRSAEPALIPRNMMREQKKIIGPMSSLELVTFVTIIALLTLVPSLKYHKIEIPWLFMTISMVLLLIGTIGQKEFRSEIDWPLLIFIGAVLAWAPVISAIGLDSVISRSLSGVSVLIKSHFYWFVGLFCGAIMLVRLVLPITAATVIIGTVAMPIAMDAGLSPWPVAFIILTMVEATLFPYQDQLRLQLDGSMAQQGLTGVADETRFFGFDMMMIVVRIAVIYASIPFWQNLDII